MIFLVAVISYIFHFYFKAIKNEIEQKSLKFK
jgi:hypothetical protein